MAPKLPPWDEPDEQSFITRDEMAKAIKQASAALEKRILNRETYTLHAQLHRPGDRDPVDWLGNDPDGLGGTGLWPQMKPAVAVPIVSGTVTLQPTQDLYHLGGTGTVESTPATTIGVITEGEDFWGYDIATDAWTQRANNIPGTTAGAGVWMDKLRAWQYGTSTVLFAILRLDASGVTDSSGAGTLMRSLDIGATWEAVYSGTLDSVVDAYGVVDYDIAPDGDVFFLESRQNESATLDDSNDDFPLRVWRSPAVSRGALGTFSVLYTDAGYNEVSPAHNNLSVPAVKFAINSTGTRILILPAAAGDCPTAISGVGSGGSWVFTQRTWTIPNSTFESFDRLHAANSGRFIFALPDNGEVHYSDDHGENWTLATGYSGTPHELGWWRESWGDRNILGTGDDIYISTDNGATWTDIYNQNTNVDGLDYSPALDQIFFTPSDLTDAFLIDTPFDTPSADAIPNAPASDADGEFHIGAYIGEISSSDVSMASVLHTINGYPSNRFTVFRITDASAPITITEQGNIVILNPTTDATYGDVIALADVNTWVLLWYEPSQGKYLAYAMRDTSPGSGSEPDLMLPATSVTIASGAITVVTRPEGIAHYIVRGEGAAADELETINGGVDSRWLLIEPGEGGEDIDILQTGNIFFPNTNGISLSFSEGDGLVALLQYDSSQARWIGFQFNFVSQVQSANASVVLEDQSATESRIGMAGGIYFDGQDVTIASGKLTNVVNSGLIRVAGEGGVDDDLDSIDHSDSIVFLIITPKSDTQTITIKHNDAGGTTGFKFFTSTGSDIVLDALGKFAIAVWTDEGLDSGSGGWMVMPNTGGGGGASDAADLTYTPASNADWGGSDPGDADQALDVLADRTSKGREYIRAEQFIPAIAKTNPSGLAATKATTTNDVTWRGIPFPNTGAFYAHFRTKMPANWDAGTISVIPDWTFESSSGDVVWQLAGLARSNDDAMDTAFGTAATSTDTALTALDWHVAPAATVTVGGTPAAGDALWIEVLRDSAHASDTLGATAYLMGVEIIYGLTAAGVG